MAQKHSIDYTEYPMTRDGRIQGPSRRYRRLRHPIFPAATWTAKNPLLQRGEIGAESDTYRMKIGDGITYWNDLPYSSEPTISWGDIQGDIADQTDLQNALNAKQDTLTAGTNITIDANNVISSTAQESFFRGNWATWADVPTQANLYPEDYTGSHTPTNYDYMVVSDASQFIPVGDLMHKLVVENLAATEAFTIRITDENGVSQKYYWENYKRVFVAIDDYYSLRYDPSNPGIWSIKTNDGSPIIIKGTTYSSGQAQLCSTADPATPFDVGIPPSAGQYTGAWRFIFVGDWATVGKVGWRPQYQIGTAFTQEQQAAIDSGITKNMVDNYVNPTSTANTAYNKRITALETDKRDIINSANKVYATDANGANKNDLVYSTSATADTIAQRGTNGVLKVGTPTDNADATTKLYVDTIASAKQDNISDLATIRSGAALGATAVQPGDLATVATTGDYDDLLNKPTIPTVNDATLTIQQNGTTVNTFTANASSNVTANITVPTKISDLTNDSNFANTDLSNLTSTGANISNWSSNVSNCITEIPQDIKLELNAGILTLKAGSKVYVPNGTDVFDAITTTSDLTISSVGSGSENILIFYTNGSLMARPISACFSGPTQPTVTTTTAEWYDTANNVIKHTSDTGSTWTTPGTSLPICECSRSSGTLTGIVNTFEGFGYIGSTVFALPGITVSMPHGRTSSDLLDSTYYTTTTVSISSESYNETVYNLDIGLGPSGISLYNYVYSEMFNIVSNGSIAIVGNVDYVLGRVTRFTNKYPFHAVDYNDRSFIGHQAMPSKKYINLTLGSSGDTYRAPADGYLVLAKTADAADQYVSLRNVSTNQCTNCYIPTPGNVGRVTIPASKGDGINVVYTTGGATTVFRFVYTNGIQ